jgi:molecular chaperone DnaJ
VKGQNVQVEVDVVLKEVYNGGKKKIKYTTLNNCRHCNGTGSDNGVVESCPHCNGTGMITDKIQRGNMIQMATRVCPHCNATGKIITDPCPHCSGQGVKWAKEKFSFKIPYGVINMPQIQVPRMGHSCPRGGSIPTENGDLIISFNLKKDDYFMLVQPNNLLHVEKVPLADALLGTTLKVKDIEGKEIKIKVDELTESGKVYTFDGKGMKDRFGRRGIFAVKLEYDMPKKLTPELKKALKDLK